MTRDEFIRIVQRQAYLNEQDAERVSVAILHTLRSQLSNVEIIDIYDTLPEDIDALWEGSWLQRLMTRLQGLRVMDRDEFIEQVREAADVRTPDEAERLARAVFYALKQAIPQEEVIHVSRDLPDPLRDLWEAA